MRPTGSITFRTIFTVFSKPSSFSGSALPWASAQAAGTSIFTRAWAPASMAAQFFSTMSRPFFR